MIFALDRRPRSSFSPALALALLTALVSARSEASGFYYADLGARELGRGATGTAGTGDLSSIIYNPAGLADLTGLTVQLDFQEANQPTSFARSGGCGLSGDPCATVMQTSGYFPNTLSGVALELGQFSESLRGLVVAIGAHGPSAVGAKQYPDPRNFSTAAEAATGAPQRYSLINSQNFLFYPGIHVAYRLADWLSLGVGSEVRIFHITSVQSIFAVGGLTIDDPDFDAIADIDAKESAHVVFDGGILARPFSSMSNISIGLSGRLGAPVHAQGTIDLQVPALAASLNTVVQGNQAAIDFRLPSEARLGIQWKGERSLLELDGTWEGWGALQSLTVTPENVTLSTGTGANKTTTQIAPIVVRKDFHGAFTGRAGGEWRLPEGVSKSLPGEAEVTLRVGAIYEGSAIPDQTLAVDFVDGPRFAGTVGFSVAAHGFAFTFGYAHYFQSERDVTDSQVERTSAIPGASIIVGNGTYTTSLDALAVELTWHGL